LWAWPADQHHGVGPESAGARNDRLHRGVTVLVSHSGTGGDLRFGLWLGTMPPPRGACRFAGLSGHSFHSRRAWLPPGSDGGFRLPLPRRPTPARGRSPISRPPQPCPRSAPFGPSPSSRPASAPRPSDPSLTPSRVPNNIGGHAGNTENRSRPSVHRRSVGRR